MMLSALSHNYSRRIVGGAPHVSRLAALVAAGFLCFIPVAPVVAQNAARESDAILVRILAAEDTRLWSPELARLMSAPQRAVRARAALAAGRIGDDRAVPALAARLRSDADEQVRLTAAFALGETESSAAADVLLEAARTERSPRVRARVIEALGKIAGALPDAESARRLLIGARLLGALDALASADASRAGSSRAARARAGQNREVVLAALTAVMRARPAQAAKSVRPFLASPDAEVRATALNTLARLRVKDASDAVRPLLADADPVVRANAARVLGAAADKASLAPLAERASTDQDERVRASAIRALAALDDRSAVTGLRARLLALTPARDDASQASSARRLAPAANQNELLEIAAALGSLLAGTNDEMAAGELRRSRDAVALRAPEIEIALARIAPAAYVRDDHVRRVTSQPAAESWHASASVAEALGEVARRTSASTAGGGNTDVVVRADALIRLRQMLDAPDLHQSARPFLLRSLALFAPPDLAATLARQLKGGDVFTRAAAAEMLGDLAAAPAVSAGASQPAGAIRNAAATARTSATPTPVSTPAPAGGMDREAVVDELASALAPALKDSEPDAALAILTALAQQSDRRASDFLATALAAPDPLVRRRAAALLRLRAGGAEVASSLVTGGGLPQTQFTNEDYARAVARGAKRVLARVTTDRGAFTIELLPDDAPLTVDNFVRLAARGFFDGQEFHRVVPNFVVQTGDPRGDGNGGPGYTIRCEINFVPYTRGAIGMALSGKDTGGSQWFVTHSPQPHLDGGYTVFGRVVEGMETIDRIARGDRIQSVRITETPLRGGRPAAATRRAD